MDERWTLDELVGRVERALAGAAIGAPNGRVTPVPDARTIRWYATVGLVDRPAAMRGRTALYGRRHLLQLVAVKRLQAQGRPLAEIQAELTGATDAALADIAQLPDHDAAGPPRFWAARPAVRNPRPLLLHAVTLGEAVLLLPTTISDEDAIAIRAAAQPLMDLLSQRGITTEGKR